MEKITPVKKKTYDRDMHRELKPLQHLHDIIDALSADSAYMPIHEDLSLKLSEDGQSQCVLLHKGHVDLCRQSDKLVLNTENAPFIFGLSNLSMTDRRLILVPSQDAVISTLPLEKALDIIGKKALWPSLAFLLIYISSRIYEHYVRLSQVNSYETIRTLLHELLEEPENIRESTTVLHYIQSRSYLSRSGILRILSELCTGGYIELSESKLKKINFLPKKF